MGKPNAFMAAHADKLRREYQGQLACAIELDLIALILAVNAAPGVNVGPGRIDRVLQAFRDARVEISDTINEDGEVDRDLEYSKRKLADRVKAILGPGNWAKYKKNFPLLRTYWED